MKAQVGSILIISWSLQKPKLIIVITPPLHLLSQVFIHSCPCHVLPHLSGHKGFQKPLGKGEGSIYGTHWHSLEGMYIYIYKLNMYIYIYTHLPSLYICTTRWFKPWPLHTQTLEVTNNLQKGHVFTIPNYGHKDLSSILYKILSWLIGTSTLPFLKLTTKAP